MTTVGSPGDLGNELSTGQVCGIKAADPGELLYLARPIRPVVTITNQISTIHQILSCGNFIFTWSSWPNFELLSTTASWGFRLVSGHSTATTIGSGHEIQPANRMSDDHPAIFG